MYPEKVKNEMSGYATTKKQENMKHNVLERQKSTPKKAKNEIAGYATAKKQEKYET
ncbi:MAG: hypothetical protein ACLUR5_08300 [Eubacterium ventriosum]